jgi:hypothetical protein
MKAIPYTLLCAVLLVTLSAPAAASDFQQNEVNVGTVLADFFIVRPLAMVWLIGSAPISAAAMPVAAMTGNSGQVAKVMLSTPFWHAIKRPLGDFSSEQD